MPNATVNPIQTISVKVDSGKQTVVQSTSQFVGAQNQSLVNEISNIGIIANNASNTANSALANVAYLQATNDTQNTSIIIIQGVDETQNVYIQAAFDKANTSGTSETANVIYLQGALNSANANISTIQGVDLTQNVSISAAFGLANTLQGGLNTANANITIIQGVDNAQNAAITIVQGVDVGQNTNIATIQGVDLTQNASISAAYTLANTLQGGLNTANANIVINQGVDLTQNANITIIQGVDVGQNAAITIIQGVDLTQNTNISTIQGVDLTQNASITAAFLLANTLQGGLNTANAAIVVNQGVDNTQNTNIATIQGVDLTQNAAITASFALTNTTSILAQAAFNKANTGGSSGYLANSVLFANTTGYLSNTNNIQFISSNNSLYVANAVITGFGIVFPDGSTQVTSASGAATDAIARASAQAAYDKANTASSNTVIIQGVDLTQNAAITIIQGVDVGQNTTITAIQGVDLTQNASIAAAFTLANTLQGGLNTANASIVVGQGVNNTQNANITIIQGVDVGQNAAITIIQNTDLTQNAAITAAFNTANSKFNSSGGTISGDVSLTGNLVITGSNVSLGSVANVHITGGNTQQFLITNGSGTLSWIDLPLANTVSYTANSITLTNGVYISGNVQSIQTFGDQGTGGYYNFTDGSNTGPAWIVNVDFLNITSFNRVAMNIQYTQNSGHTIYVDLYNYGSSSWDSIGSYTGLLGYYQFALEALSSVPYVSGGKVQLRLYHSNTGNVAHETRIDYIALQTSSQGPQGPRGANGATGTTGATGNGVATGGTTNQILIKNSSTNYDTAWVDNFAFDRANTVQGGLDTANANITISQGVNNTQNANITIIQGVDIGQNAAITIIQGVDTTQNTNIATIQGVDLTQNASISAVFGLANTLQGGLNTANANIVIGQGVDNTQNSAITIIQGVDTTQNTNISTIQGVDLTQNSSISAAFNKANSANILAQAAFDKANTGTSGGISASGYLANSIIYANTSGYLSNVSSLAYFTSNSTFAAPNISTTSVYATNIYGSGVDLLTYTQSAYAKANSKTYTFAQNTAPATANNQDLWVQVDTGVVYQNFGNTTYPVWAEFGPSGQLANTQPGIITATSGTFSGQLNVTYQPATTIGSAIQITAANTQGGTGYADALTITNSSFGATNANKTIRLTSIGELQVVNSAYQMTPLSLTDRGDLTLAGNSTTNGIAAGYAPNRPAFKVAGNGGSISATTTVAGGYMVVDYNQGSYLNTTTGIFTAPVAGLYQVNVVVRTQSNANPSINQIIIRKTAAIGGAVTTQIMVEFGVNTTMNHAGGSALVKMAVGDTLKFDVTSGSISFDGNDNWSVAYIG